MRRSRLVCYGGPGAKRALPARDERAPASLPRRQKNSTIWEARQALSHRIGKPTIEPETTAAHRLDRVSCTSQLSTQMANVNAKQ